MGSYRDVPYHLDYVNPVGDIQDWNIYLLLQLEKIWRSFGEDMPLYILHTLSKQYIQLEMIGDSSDPLLQHFRLVLAR